MKRSKARSAPGLSDDVATLSDNMRDFIKQQLILENVRRVPELFYATKKYLLL